jgi:hypothetical protein
MLSTERQKMKNDVRSLYKHITQSERPAGNKQKKDGGR